MAHRFDPAQKDKLDTKERRRNLPPEKILEKFNLATTDVVADIGCGIGYFTVPIAQLVNNKVYAVDISQEMLDEVTTAKQEHGLDNIELINNQLQSNALEDETIDFMLMSNLVHEVETKEEFLESYLAKLRPGGRLAIIDFKKISTDFGPPVEEKISKAKLYNLLEELGLEVKLVTDLNQEQYGILAKK
ncbi:MAG: class I SAM-dependent methyltransferase [Bacillota bacterium]